LIFLWKYVRSGQASPVPSDLHDFAFFDQQQFKKSKKPIKPSVEAECHFIAAEMTKKI
jgi:hypothetical protein